MKWEGGYLRTGTLDFHFYTPTGKCNRASCSFHYSVLDLDR